MSTPLPVRSRVARQVQTLPLGKQAVSAIRGFFGEGQPHEQWQRIVLNREARRLIDELEPSRLDALEISGWNWPTEGYFRSHRAVSYPEFDICEGALDERFDLIIAEQVFEHLLWPYRAGRNVCEMLRPGGWFFIATPFLIKIHECPHDCSRWTEAGLKYLLAECGFPLENVHTGSWGSRACLRANLRRWRVYRAWRDSLRNEREYPLQVWALAQKEDERDGFVRLTGEEMSEGRPAAPVPEGQ